MPKKVRKSLILSSGIHLVRIGNKAYYYDMTNFEEQKTIQSKKRKSESLCYRSSAYEKSNLITNRLRNEEFAEETQVHDFKVFMGKSCNACE